VAKRLKSIKLVFTTATGQLLYVELASEFCIRHPVAQIWLEFWGRRVDPEGWAWGGGYTMNFSLEMACFGAF